MSFTFEARTLLELGKELISSDDVALYELIKNSIDAGSPTVDVTVTSRLLASDVREAIRRLEETSAEKSEIRDFLKSKFLFEDEKTNELIDALDDSTKRTEFAATLTEHYRSLNQIIVKDTGDGMSFDDLQNIYLRIGTRSRRKLNDQGATMLGDKGIGRLSAMRLGESLSVKTSEAGDPHWNRLYIDWSDFSHTEDKLVQDVPVSPVVGKKKDDPSEHGTRIAIRDLNADWGKFRFEEILEGRVARFFDPFEPGLANKIIRARHNGKRVLVPSIPKQLLKSAHAVCRAKLRFEPRDDGEGIEPVITGEIRYGPYSTTIEARGVELRSVTMDVKKRRAKRGHAQFEETPISRAAIERLGEFDTEIYWYNRRIVEAIDELTENQSQTRDLIRQWSGGPMLYRHGYRVLPYGDPDDDWLALDKRAFGVSGFKLNRQQVIGRVSIETPHRYLSEQTNREGLVQSDVSDALTRLMGWIVHVEFREFINLIDDREELQRRKDRLKNVGIVRASEALEKAVEKFNDEAEGEYEELTQEILARTNKLRKEAFSVFKRIEEFEDQAISEREKFVYLAGIGLMTEFIFHELERAVSSTMRTLSGKRSAQNLEALREQLKTLQKRISAFDELTGEKRQSKTTFDLIELIEDLLANHSEEFSRHNIDVELVLPKGEFPIRAVKGMLIQIIENLIVNSAFWLKSQSEYEEGFDPELKVELDVDARQLRVTDNGPGVPKGRKERIFQPFVTSKPPGTGKGLGLYIAAEMATYHKWTLEAGGAIGEVRPGRINTFVLQMGDA